MKREGLVCGLGILVLVLIVITAINISALFGGDETYWGGKEDVSLAATGDVMIGTKVTSSLDSVFTPFEDVKDVLAS